MWTREVGLPAGLVVAALSLIASTAHAQEPTPEATVRISSPDGTYQVLPDQPRARLGLFLDPGCAVPDTDGVCTNPPIVVSVVENGPADRAGVRQRDTLIALDGSRLSSLEGQRALQSLESGRSVLLTVSGPEGRRDIAVMPELRAPARVMKFEWRSPDEGGESEQVMMYRFPAVESIGELELSLDSIVGEDRERAFVMFGPDSEGELRVEIVGTEPGIYRSRVVAGTPDTTLTMGYVVESRELVQRLEAVRSRTLQTARIQLDSLLHSQSGNIEFMIAPNRRVAGAEFLALTPELAENFAGVQEGLLVLRVIPNTPAGVLGLRGGDVVVEADGDPARSIESFRARILHAGTESVVVKWIRKGVESEGRLKLR